MKVIDHLKMFNRLFSAGYLPIEFGQDSIGKYPEHAGGVQKTVFFRNVISKRQYIYHFKTIEVAVAYFEVTVIYHFKKSIISKLLISKG